MKHAKNMCIDCWKDIDEIHERFIVYSDMQKRAGIDNYPDICVGCMEKRLGRKLTKTDFPENRVNFPSTRPYAAPNQHLNDDDNMIKSRRLKNRIKRHGVRWYNRLNF